MLIFAVIIPVILIVVVIGYFFPYWYGTPPLQIDLGYSDEQTLLQDVRTAYEDLDGNGVLISEALSTSLNDVFIDGSGCLVKKDFNNQLFISLPYFFGYVWHPKDNLAVIQCTFTTDAATDDRFKINGSRCSFSATKKPSYPIMCAAQETKCTADDKCFDNDVNAKTTGFCPKSQKCPQALCKANQNCIQCMFQQSISQQNKYSNFSSTNCPTCLYNEVVFASELPDSKNTLRSVLKIFKKSNRPGPSAIIIGVPYDWTKSGQKFVKGKTSCKELFSNNSKMIQWLKANFVPDTIILFMRCNSQTFNTKLGDNELISKMTRKDIDFEDAYLLKHLNNQICQY